MAGDVRRPNVLVRTIRGPVGHELEMAAECIIVIRRDRVSDLASRPPSTDRAGKAADHETNRSADRADRHAGRGAEDASRALTDCLGVAVHTRRCGVPRGSALRFGEGEVALISFAGHSHTPRLASPTT